MNDNVLLTQVTHSSYKKRNRKNLPIRNLNSNDLDREGKIKESFLKKRPYSKLNFK